MRCRAEHCQSVDLIAKGYCWKHYIQQHRHGRLTPEREHRQACEVEDCEKKHMAKGMCSKHYFRNRHKLNQAVKTLLRKG